MTTEPAWTLWPEITRAYPARPLSLGVVAKYRVVQTARTWDWVHRLALRYAQWSLMRRVFPWRPSYMLRGDPITEILVADPLRRDDLIEFVISQTVAYDG